ncbi:MAG: NHLP leader peptide family natural product precursor [Phycisphaera sp.]|nr:NHLP leader peptide family natural product precursor [Phycisphaera sp.]
MNNDHGHLERLFVACWKDDAVRDRFLDDPRSVLAEFGVEVPEDLEVRVVQNDDDLVHVTLPATPASHPSLSDEELSLAAGGAAMHTGSECLTYLKACPPHSCSDGYHC